jgi:phage shock protein E
LNNPSSIIVFLFGLSLIYLFIRKRKLAMDAKTRIKNGALVVDVRTPKEVAAEGHLNGALLIPHTELESRISELGADLNREIVFYCQAGGRAGKAQEIAKHHGYVNSYNGGGYKDLK